MSTYSSALGIYVSVPFCRAKCSFCNFASGVSSPEVVERYLSCLCLEIQQSRDAASAAGLELPEIVDSIYLGGGTPSLLQPGQVHRLFAALRSNFAIHRGAEITLEAAPGQIADDVLEAALECGVNRVSLGVQSFVDGESQAVGRSHTATGCLSEFVRLRAAGVTDLGADLIAGLPYQTAVSWERSLDAALRADLDHLSVYLLEVDAESRLGREVLGGGARLHAPAVPSDELMATLYERACERLAGGGFEQYEISNFARAGHRSKHNLKYWQRDPYLGFGLDAHSMLLGREGDVWRWSNPDVLAEYRGASRMGEATPASPREVFEEKVFLGLRLAEGLAWSSFSGLTGDPETPWVEELREGVRRLEGDGLLSEGGGRVRLTERGRLVSSEIFGELLAGVPA